ncbi:MAG: glycine zipper 2TM domain-containing protein [Proteobacteria bacterium]|nr:glycine zipper 2TM domain-containing protein [Pseudomonadota bacterium]
MFNKLAMLASASVVAMGLAASPASARAHYYYGDDCRDQNRTAGTIIGAIAGGLIGNQFGRGSGNVAATIGGVFIGGAIGNKIAGDIDCDDRPYAFNAYRDDFDGPVGERREWQGRHNHGYIVTTREYWRHGRVCRDFYEVSYRHDEEYRREGTACRDRYGDWRFM